MQKGQIVRRMVNSGTPVGPYMRIINAQGAWVEVEKLDSGFCTAILKTHVYEPKVVKLIIPDVILDRIKSGIQKAIIHDLTPRWEQLRKIKPEVISLRSIKYSQKVVLFSVQEMRIVYYNRQPQLRVEIAEMLYKHD